MRTKALVASTVLALMVIAPLTAQSQKQQILNELRAIRQLLEKLTAPDGPPAAPVPTSDKVTLTNLTGYIIGKPDAPLTMVEFTDLQCPFCRVYHVTTFEQLKRDYIDTGKLRYISRDFPLEAIHPLANAAARSSRKAATASSPRRAPLDVQAIRASFGRCGTSFWRTIRRSARTCSRPSHRI